MLVTPSKQTFDYANLPLLFLSRQVGVAIGDSMAWTDATVRAKREKLAEIDAAIDHIENGDGAVSIAGVSASIDSSLDIQRNVRRLYARKAALAGLLAAYTEVE